MVKAELGWSGTDTSENSETPRKLRAIVKLRASNCEQKRWFHNKKIPRRQKVTFHFMAVGDCLVPWQTWPRLFQSFFKGIFRDEGSCKKPNHYADRMLAGFDYYFNRDGLSGDYSLTANGRREAQRVKSLDSLTGSLETFEAYRPSYIQKMIKSIQKYQLSLLPPSSHEAFYHDRNMLRRYKEPAGGVWLKMMLSPGQTAETHAYFPNQPKKEKNPSASSSSPWLYCSIAAALPIAFAFVYRMAVGMAA